MVVMSQLLIRGTGACAGKVKGIVKIVEGPEDARKMKEGDILVAPFTTPLLTLAMTRALAIVTDTGGLTCHAAVVARELGVPCVVGTKNATKVLRDGMTVIVDGGKGLVFTENT